MNGKLFTGQKIRLILKERDTGVKVPDRVRKHNFSEQVIYHWKSKFGSLDLPDTKCLRELVQGNARLKKLLSEAELDKSILKDVISKKVVTPYLPDDYDQSQVNALHTAAATQEYDAAGTAAVAGQAVPLRI